MDAKNSVTLSTNFNAVAGSNFTAKIGGCTASIVPEEEFVATRQLIESTASTFTQQKDLDFSIYPSPASGEVTIDLFLEASSEVVITLHGSMGNIVKVIQNSGNFEEGNQQLRFNANDLQSGLYFVVISTPTIRKSQKLLVQRN